MTLSISNSLDACVRFLSMWMLLYMMCCNALICLCLSRADVKPERSKDTNRATRRQNINNKAFHQRTETLTHSSFHRNFGLFPKIKHNESQRCSVCNDSKLGQAEDNPSYKVILYQKVTQMIIKHVILFICPTLEHSHHVTVAVRIHTWPTLIH